MRRELFYDKSSTAGNDAVVTLNKENRWAWVEETMQEEKATGKRRTES